MKRSEIQAGHEYLVAPTGNWDQERSYGHERVRVLDLRPWAGDRWGSRDTKVQAETATGTLHVPERFRPASTGNGVLVEVLDKATGKPVDRRYGAYDVVQLAAIRGDWETLWKAREERIESQRRIAEREADKHAKAVDLAKTYAEHIGGSVESHRLLGSGPKIVLTMDQAKALIDRLG